MPKRWQVKRLELITFKGRQKILKNKGVVEEEENREIALRFIRNVVVHDLGKSIIIGVLGDGNQRSDC